MWITEISCVIEDCDRTTKTEKNDLLLPIVMFPRLFIQQSVSNVYQNAAILFSPPIAFVP